MSDTLDRSEQQRRILWLGIVFGVAATIVLGRVLAHQYAPTPDLQDIVSGPARSNKTEAIRGSIFDATGHYMTASMPTYEISISPRDIPTKTVPILTTELANILDKDQRQLQSLIEDNDTMWLPLWAGVPIDKATDIAALGYTSIQVEMSEQRVYPNGQMAAPVLGFVDADDEGQYGIERYYDRDLQGSDGEWYGIQGKQGRPLLMSSQGYRTVQDGADIVLAIDRNIQHKAEEILRASMEKTKATAGNLIVMDPRTGAVLAMTNLPTYDPAKFWEFSSWDVLRNTSISAAYEPGSVFKAFTLAAALETRVITSDYVYSDRGEIRMGDRLIQNADKKAHGPTSMTKMIALSLNVGAAHLATLLGPTRFYESLRDFGFGSVTGIDLAAEEDGIMRVPGWPNWSLSDLGANSYGQGISVTPIQVIAGFAAIANDGVLMRPFVAYEMRHGSETETRKPFRVRRVLSPEVAHQTQEILADGMELGMPKAVVPGYRFAGKSGTAQIQTEYGYSEDDVIASFVGFGPLPDARFVIMVKLDKPRNGLYGVDIAAPEFRAMAQYLVDYYGIAPDS